MKRICVFCGSSPGSKPEYIKMASQLGKTLAQNRLGLVYGGGSLGMMGVIANTAHHEGVHVTGVITRHLMEMEVAFTELDDLRVVETMHERKALMADLSDGFIALPGGFGTMEEIFEVLTWSQLNLHKKPCGFLNADGYFDGLITFIEHMISQEFVHEDCRRLLFIDNDPQALLNHFKTFSPLYSDKGEWAKRLAEVKQLHKN